MIEKIGHYSLTNNASVYDEEAMTALELAGRTAKKVNEVIDALADQDDEIAKIPNQITTAIRKTVNDGTFDYEISRYLNDLDKRLNNLLSFTPTGGTSMDAEVVDGRLGGDGTYYANLGSAIREQFLDAKESADDRPSIEALAHGYRRNLNHRTLWEQGWLSSETGLNGNTGSDYAMYIRSANFISENVIRVISNGLPMEVFRYNKSGGFHDKITTRLNDYTFDHSIYKYKIHVTGYVDNIPNFDTKKVEITRDDYQNILFLADPISEDVDFVSARAEANGYRRDLNQRVLWSQGYLYGANGSEGVDPSGYDYWIYSRSEFLPNGVEKIFVEPSFTVRLFKYKIDGTFVKYETVTGLSDTLDVSYRYRVDIKPSRTEFGSRHLVTDIWNKVVFLVEKSQKGDSPSNGVDSPFKINAEYPAYHHEYVDVEGGSWIADALSSNVVMSDRFETFATTYMFNATTIGKDSGGLDILVNRFTPRYKDETTPKILVVGGQHGFERASVWGILMLNSLFMNDYGHDLDFLGHIELITIPCLCPTAYNAQTYKNANGVNLNRNYPYGWVKEANKLSDYYGGEEPFDQPETRALRDFILREKPDIVLDFHTLGQTMVSSTRDMNVFYACGFTDPVYTKLRKAIRAHLIKQSRNYGMSNASDTIEYGRFTGFDGTINTTPSLDNWCAYTLNTLSLTVEGCHGCPSAELTNYTDIIAFNAKIIINFLGELVAEMSRGV